MSACLYFLFQSLCFISHFLLCSTSLRFALIVFFLVVSPLSKSPCHISSLLSSIYICLFLPCPSFTSHSPLASFIPFFLGFPLCFFSISLLPLQLTPSFSFLANHYSFSFVSSDAACPFPWAEPPLRPPSSAHPSLLCLSHCTAPVAGWGGRLGASMLLLLLQTLCWDVMLLVCCRRVCVCV